MNSLGEVSSVRSDRIVSYRVCLVKLFNAAIVPVSELTALVS
jgi:hypothetical protein